MSRSVECETSFFSLDEEPQQTWANWPFEENPVDTRNFAKIRHQTQRRQRGGASSSQKGKRRKQPGTEIGWTRGPGRHNVRNIPKGSDVEGGPWTGKNETTASQT